MSGTLVFQLLLAAPVYRNVNDGVFLWNRRQRDGRLFCTFRVTFTRTKDVGKSSCHHDDGDDDDDDDDDYCSDAWCNG